MAAEMAVEITVQETVLTEDRQAKVEHSEATVQEDHLERAETVQEDRLARVEIVQEDLSERILREEASVIENLQETEVSTLQKRASTRRISIISAMKMRAESTR